MNYVRRALRFFFRPEKDHHFFDLVAFDRKDLGVPKRLPIFRRHAVQHERMVSGFDELFDLEAHDPLGVRPAAYEIRRSIDVVVGRTREDEIVGEQRFDDRPGLFRRTRDSSRG
jgi:hypothetical protein